MKILTPLLAASALALLVGCAEERIDDQVTRAYDRQAAAIDLRAEQLRTQAEQMKRQVSTLENQASELEKQAGQIRETGQNRSRQVTEGAISRSEAMPRTVPPPAPAAPAQ